MHKYTLHIRIYIYVYIIHCPDLYMYVNICLYIYIYTRSPFLEVSTLQQHTGREGQRRVEAWENLFGFLFFAWRCLNNGDVPVMTSHWLRVTENVWEPHQQKNMVTMVMGVCSWNPTETAWRSCFTSCTGARAPVNFKGTLIMIGLRTSFRPKNEVGGRVFSQFLQEQASAWCWQRTSILHINYMLL